MKSTITDRRTTFTTLNGTEIHFVPFSWDEYQLARAGLMDEYRTRGELIDCPQYTVTFASGTTQQFDHNETTIKDVPPGTAEQDVDKVLDAQREMWLKYQDALKRFNAEDQIVLNEMVYEDSLGGIVLPSDTTWETRQTKRRIKIPTDPEEKRQHYINTVLLKGKSDQLDLLSTIVAVSMGVVKEADLEAVKASFRDQVWGDISGRLLGRQGPGETKNPPVGPMDGQPPTDIDSGAESVVINEGTI